jgi:D-alanyl-D-alanine carboxypeptidase (penicillin-binding protein 5/6)
MKTGYTNAAGHCLVSSGQNNGRDVIAVILGSNKANVFTDSKRLLEWGLRL